MRNSGKALLGFMLQHKGGKTSNRHPLSALLEAELVSEMGWVQDGSRGWAGGLPTRLVVLCAGRMFGTLPLLLVHQKWQLSFWSFYILPFILCPNWKHTVTFSPLWFLCICCSRRHLSRCKHCSQGSQVRACLKALWWTVLSVPGIVCLEKKEYFLSKSSPHSDQGYIQRVLAMMQKPKDVGCIGRALRIHLYAAVAKTKRWGGRI